MKKGTSASMARRLIIAKTFGLAVGLLAFFLLPYMWEGVPNFLRWGILLWYVTFGAMVGLMGVLDHHPVWKSWKFPAWFRGTCIGAWLNFVLVFFAYEPMQTLLGQLDWGIVSPWWFVLEGALLGLIIDLIATYYGGEGKKLL